MTFKELYLKFLDMYGVNNMTVSEVFFRGDYEFFRWDDEVPKNLVKGLRDDLKEYVNLKRRNGIWR